MNVTFSRYGSVSLVVATMMQSTHRNTLRVLPSLSVSINFVDWLSLVVTCFLCQAYPTTSLYQCQLPSY